MYTHDSSSDFITHLLKHLALFLKCPTLDRTQNIVSNELRTTLARYTDHIEQNVDVAPLWPETLEHSYTLCVTHTTVPYTTQNKNFNLVTFGLEHHSSILKHLVTPTQPSHS